MPVIEGKVIRQKDAKRGSIFDNLFFLLAKVIKVENSVGGELVLEAVPIVTPNCDLVVPSLSLTVIFIFIVSLHLHCNNRWCRASMCWFRDPTGVESLLYLGLPPHFIFVLLYLLSSNGVLRSKLRSISEVIWSECWLRHDICHFYTSRFFKVLKVTRRKRVIREISNPKYWFFSIPIHSIGMLYQFTHLYSHIELYTG